MLAAATRPHRPIPPSGLRPRQLDALEAVWHHYFDKRIDSMLVSIPTGVGKTRLSVSAACATDPRSGRRVFERVLFLAHRSELVQQTLATYRAITPNGSSASVTAGQRGAPADVHFTVAMIQTLARRLQHYDPARYDLIVVDEAHHAMAPDWKRTISHFTPALLLGLSATPERQDGAPLSDLFRALAYHMSVAEAVREGLLTPPVALQVVTNTDLSGIKRVRGDYDQAELQRTVNTPARNKLVLKTFLEHARQRRAIGFTAGVQHARDLEALFASHGLRTISVAGNDPDRDERIAAFERGEYQIAWNAALLTEGYDNPSIDCVLMARPTQSVGLYVQAVGRALRLHPGKRDALIVDYTDTSSRIRLVNIWDFWGSRVARNTTTPTNLLEATERITNHDTPHDDRIDLTAYLQRVDLLEPPPEVDEHVIGAFEWHRQDATEKQLAALERLGFETDPSKVTWTRGQASAVIGREPATEKQQRLLLALGFDTVSYAWSKPQASRAIARAQEEGRTPDWGLVRELEQRRGS